MHRVMILNPMKAHRVPEKMEQVGNGRLGVQAVFHVGLHPGKLGAVTKPRVASLRSVDRPVSIRCRLY